MFGPGHALDATPVPDHTGSAMAPMLHLLMYLAHGRRAVGSRAFITDGGGSAVGI
jgi:hypothetical protein